VTAVLLGLLLTGAVAWVGRRWEGSWLAPAPFFAAGWSLYAALAALFVVDLDVYAPAVFWVFAASAAVLAGAAASRRPSRAGGGSSPPGGASPPVAAFPYLRAITAGLVTVGLLEVGYIFAKAGFSPRALLSVAVIAQISAYNRHAFGYGDLQQGVGERVAFMLIYTAPLFGGLLFRLGNATRDRLLGALTLILVTFVAMLYGSRMGVLFGGSFWLSSWVAGQVLVRKDRAGEGGRFLLGFAAIAVLIILGLSLLAMIVRYYATSDRNRPLMVLISDPFSFIAAFAIWFQNEGWRLSEFLGGYRTFLRLLQVFGVRAAWPPAIDVGFSSSNIYTVFRGLIEDFGTLGALLFLFGFGALGGWAYRRVRDGEAGAIPWLTMVLAFTLVGFSFSLFAYTTPTLGVLSFFGYFVLRQRLLEASAASARRVAAGPEEPLGERA